MQSKNPKAAHKIIQKIPLKNKVLMKSIISDKSELMVTRFNHEDTLAACGYSDGFVRVFNLATDNKIWEINTSPKEAGPVNALRWRPSNEMNSLSPSVLLVGNTNGNLYQYSGKTGKEVFHTQEEGNYIMALDYSPDGYTFCTAGKDNLIRIYDQQTKKVETILSAVKWQKQGHSNRVFSVKFKKDNPDILVSGGWDQNVNIWDIRTQSVVSCIYGAKITGDAVDIREDYVLTGASRTKDQLQLWDWRQNSVVQTFRWDQYQQSNAGQIFCAQFCSYNRSAVMAVGGSDTKIFSLEDYGQIFQINFPKDNLMYSCDSGNTGTMFLCGGKNGTLFFCGNAKTLD